MKFKNLTWPLLASLATGLLLAPTSRGQPATLPVEDNEPAAQKLTNAPAAETNATEGEENAPRSHGRHGARHDVIFSIGKPVELKASDSSDAVVVIGADAKIFGKANDAVVVIFGDVEINGGHVSDAVVSILGRIKLSNGATVKGDVVAVGGEIDRSEDSTVEGETHSVEIGRFGNINLPRFKAWFIHCVLKLRPLAFQVPFVWVIGGIIFLIYLVIGALLPRPVMACVSELTRRPITTLVLGGVSLVLFLLILFILVATGIGLIIVPFLFAAVVIGFLIGKVATLEWLGLSIARQFGGEALAKPLTGLLFGGLLIMVLYLVPVLGLATFGMLAIWALGCAVTATFTGLRRESPEKPTRSATRPANPVPASEPAAASMPSSSGPAPDVGASQMTAETTPQGLALPALGPAPVAPAGVPEALAYPRAGFWERMGAAALDFFLLGVLGAMVHHPLPAFVLAVAYFVGMWTWKGTTIGGIVLALKVVRADGGPLTLTTTIVRALAGVFSAMVLFLGFLWIAWDSEKQGWHDRIAGTVVLRLPRGTPLVCL